jgi:four helix bundle protein
MQASSDSLLLPRTKQFALRVIRLVQALGDDRVARVLGDQLLRSGTSVGANYRAAARARSRPDFINKLKISEEECDESLFWMELPVEGGLLPETKLRALMIEGGEILAMLVASIQTTRRGTATPQLVTQNS